MHSPKAMGRRNTKCMCCLHKTSHKFLMDGRFCFGLLSLIFHTCWRGSPLWRKPRYLEKKVNRQMTYLKQHLRAIFFINILFYSSQSTCSYIFLFGMRKEYKCIRKPVNLVLREWDSSCSGCWNHLSDVWWWMSVNPLGSSIGAGGQVLCSCAIIFLPEHGTTPSSLKIVPVSRYLSTHMMSLLLWSATLPCPTNFWELFVS